MSGMSGIKLCEDAKDFHDREFKLDKKSGYYYLKLNDECSKFVVGEKARKYSGHGKHSEQCVKFWEEFLESLDEKKPTYAVFDFRFISKDGREQDKIIFVSWVPGEVPVKQRMVYASTKETLSKTLNVDKTFHADCKDDLKLDDIVKELQKLRG